jgi:hypothetical protein
VPASARYCDQGYGSEETPTVDETAQQGMMRKMLAATTAMQATIQERDATLHDLQEQVRSRGEQLWSRGEHLA